MGGNGRSGGAVLAVACILMRATAAMAADYWVAPAGSDAADGLSPATAWATLVHAAAVVGPGDTVHVADGDYQGFYLETSGTPGAPITFKAEGAAVAITADNPTTPDGINLEGASWVVVDGFVVNGRTRTGIRAVTASHVTVRNCSLGYNGRWGILTGFVDDFVAESNEAHHSVAEHGIYVSNSCARPVVRGNRVHDNHANGLHFNGDLSQGGGDGLVHDALVEANVIWGNGTGGGSGINMDGSVGGVIRNNLLYDNHASGVSLYRIDAGAPSTNNLIVNNTIVNPSDARWCVNVQDGSTGNVVRNNILYNAHVFRGAIAVDAASLPGFVSDYNSVVDRLSADGGDTAMTLAAWQALGYDAHSFVATPAQHFLVPGSDFHLLVTSPAIDAGTSLGAPPVDLDGGPRPVGAGIDLGAYEQQLLECGDGGADPGEQCGEPGLGCTDPCTTCLQCICATPAPTCGDGVVCGGEACEQDADCASGLCVGCQCVNPGICASGIALARPRQTLRATPARLALRADATLPEPWVAVDPPANGIRIVVDAPTGSAGVDATLPGGPQWTASGRKWVYRDAQGAVAGIVKAVVQDRRSRAPGLIRVVAKGRGGTIALPDPAGVRTAVVFGAPGECAAVAWNGPTGVSPRCRTRAGRLVCK